MYLDFGQIQLKSETQFGFIVPFNLETTEEEEVEIEKNGQRKNGEERLKREY